MRFFKMKQDVNLPYCISFRNFSITENSHIFKKEDYGQLKDNTVLYITGNGDEARPDFIEHPVHIVSADLKSILEAYEDELLFKNVSLIHMETKTEYRYVQILMDELEAVSEAAEYDSGQAKKDLVLDSRKIGSHHIFMLKDRNIKHPVVSLAVVESLLRRNVMGIRFEEVEVK